MIHRLFTLFIIFAIQAVPAVTDAGAQDNVQKGYIRTIERPGRASLPVGNVVIRVKGLMNPVMSEADGEFNILAPNLTEGDSLVLISVHRNGYELKDKDIVGRPLVFSRDVPLEIIMVDLRQLEEDRRRIEENAYRIAEEQYQSRLAELDNEKEKNAISAEEYRQELQSLQNKYESYTFLISDLADHYARTDYAQLDSLDAVINICIENGELEKADSLIRTVFNPDTVLERNRAAKDEILKRIEFAQSVIDKANLDRENILNDMEYAEKIVNLCVRLSDEYLAIGNADNAVSCLEQAMEIMVILYGDHDHRTIDIEDRINEYKKN